MKIIALILLLLALQGCVVHRDCIIVKPGMDISVPWKEEPRPLE